MRVGIVSSTGIVNQRRQQLGLNRVTAPQSVSSISFLGGVKNLNQILSLTPENKDLGLPEASQGGEGVVGAELPASLRRHEKVDCRSCMPFWEYDNPKGGFKFLRHRLSQYPNGASGLPDMMPATEFYSANVGETLEMVAEKFGLKTSELSYVIQSKPVDGKSKYCILEPTSIAGEIQRPSPSRIGEVDSVPYQLMKISKNNPSYNKLKGKADYFLYTPDLAKASKPYAYDCWGNVPFEAEIINSDWMRAMAQFVHSQMNTEEFDFFNPASVLAHDRPSATYGNHIANLSARGNTDVNGLKIHNIGHNTMRFYQGFTHDLFKYLAIVGDAKDAEALRQMPEFELLQRAQREGFDSEALSPREKQIVRDILEPFVAPFRDGEGAYNITKTGIVAAKRNPENMSIGTVSYNFDRETKSLETPEAAKFLTGDFASVETKTVANGVTPANMRFDDPTADFGRGGNGLSKMKEGFTTFKYDGSNIDEVLNAHHKNAKWITDLIYKAGEAGQDELNKLFFNSTQISEGHNVMGYLTPIKDGEVLIAGLGRPDKQKGLPITSGGVLEFFKRKDIPTEVKLKVKFISGAGPWDKSNPEYQAIARDMEELAKLEGGIFKHNYMHIDGFTPNRIFGCCHYTMFTSVEEMFGITPIESKIAGTPYGVTRVGGFVDYTNPSNGFMTKTPVDLSPEKFGLTWATPEHELTQARTRSAAKQVSDMIKDMVAVYMHDKPRYVAMAKKNIEEKVDWHENIEYNHGKSANRRYLDDIFEVGRGYEARNKSPLNRLVGTFGTFSETAEKVFNIKANSRPMKLILGVVGGLIVLTGGYFLYKNAKSEKANGFDKAA